MNERFARAEVHARVNLAHEQDFLLGHIQVRPARREIIAQEGRIRIDPRVMRVLVALARAKGEVLSRDDLIESCWDGVIVGEDAITRCISRLRKVSDSCTKAFSIETVPRVGYRLIAVEGPPTETAEGSRTDPEPVSAPADPPRTSLVDPSRQISGLFRPRFLAAVAAILLLLVIAAGFWRLSAIPHAIPVSASFPSNAPANSVAVLPFANMSGDSAKEYFSDGFSEELMKDLSDNPRLLVVSRTSAFAFKGRHEDIGTIARALNVRAIVEGSVREMGDRVRVDAQLVDGASGYRLWSASYDRGLSDILSIQDEIARAITPALTNKLLAVGLPAKSKHATAISAEAYRAYLEAQSYLSSHSSDDAAKALPLLKKVIVLQPDFEDAYAAMSLAYSTLAINEPGDTTLIPAAAAAAKRGLSLNPDNLDVLAAHLVASLDLSDWASAIVDADRMKEINPNSAVVQYSLFRFYNYMGFPDLALKSAQTAAALNPLSFPDHAAIVAQLEEMRRYKEAAAAGEAALSLHREFHSVLQSHLCTAYAFGGRLQEAQQIATEFETRKDGNAEGCRIDIAVSRHRNDEALAIIDRAAAGYGKNDWGAGGLAANYAFAGDSPKALAWMNRAYDNRETGIFAYLLSAREFAPSFYAQPGWSMIWDRPLARQWLAAHEAIAAEIGRH